MQAGIAFLEALAAYMKANATGSTNGTNGPPVLQIPLPPPEVMRRGATALQTILQGLTPAATDQNPQVDQR